jgi:hypothetical protein
MKGECNFNLPIKSCCEISEAPFEAIQLLIAEKSKKQHRNQLMKEETRHVEIHTSLAMCPNLDLTSTWKIDFKCIEEKGLSSSFAARTPHLRDRNLLVVQSLEHVPCAASYKRLPQAKEAVLHQMIHRVAT